MSKETRSEVLVLVLGAGVFVVGAGALALFDEYVSALVFLGGAVAANTFALLRVAWKG